MELHHINGTEVGFHSSAMEAVDFLKNGVHGSTAQGYLDYAKEHGEAHFYDKNGVKFTIRHESKDGQANYSVEKSDS